jgi:hypothetical protein
LSSCSNVNVGGCTTTTTTTTTPTPTPTPPTTTPATANTFKTVELDTKEGVFNDSKYTSWGHAFQKLPIYCLHGGGCSNVNVGGCGGTHEPLVLTHQEEIFFEQLFWFPSATCFLNITLAPHYCSMLSLYWLGWCVQCPWWWLFQRQW